MSKHKNDKDRLVPQSMDGISVDEALAGAMQVPPPPDKPKKKATKRPKKRKK